MLTSDNHLPGLLGQAEIENLLKHVLLLSEADETETVLEATQQSLTRFALNTLHQNVAEVNLSLQVRAVLGSRVGMAMTNDLSPLGIERTVRQAGLIARHLPENPEWPGLPDPQPLVDVFTYDESVAGMTPEARAHVAGDICSAARSQRLVASGAFSTGHTEYAVMNSKGLFAYSARTEADLAFVMEQPKESASAYAQAVGWQLDQIDAERLKQKAIERALACCPARPIKPKAYSVVLEPYAVANLIEAMSWGGMGALAVQEGRSWMNDRLGKPCLSPLISIVDDALDPDGLPRVFDCEGVPKQRVPIVVNGVPTSPVYDRLTALQEAGRSSTGHAQPYDEDWDGPLPENLALAPGQASVEDMIRSMDRGLCVMRFWYVNLTTPHNCGVTGTTRDGVWWIEHGELAYPVTNMRFDQELVQAFQSVRQVGRERRLLSSYFGGAYRVPALALESFQFVEVGDATHTVM